MSFRVGGEAAPAGPSMNEMALFFDTFSFFLIARYPCERRNVISTGKPEEVDLSSKADEVEDEREGLQLEGAEDDLETLRKEADEDEIDLRNEIKLRGIDADFLCKPLFLAMIILALQIFIYIVVFLKTVYASQYANGPPAADPLLRATQVCGMARCYRAFRCVSLGSISFYSNLFLLLLWNSFLFSETALMQRLGSLVFTDMCSVDRPLLTNRLNWSCLRTNRGCRTFLADHE